MQKFSYISIHGPCQPRPSREGTLPPRLGQPIHIVRKQAENFFNSIFACTVARHYQDQQFCQVWDQFNKRNKIYRQKHDFDKSKVLGDG